jgi:hypothetical protein
MKLPKGEIAGKGTAREGVEVRQGMESGSETVWG